MIAEAHHAAGSALFALGAVIGIVAMAQSFQPQHERVAFIVAITLLILGGAAAGMAS